MVSMSTSVLLATAVCLLDDPAPRRHSAEKGPGFIASTEVLDGHRWDYDGDLSLSAPPVPGW
jgi:hypothetical protein